MSFAYPYFFMIMIVPFIIFAFLVLSNRDRVSRVFDEKVLERLRVDGDVLPAKLRSVVVLISVFMMIVALARPVVEKGEQTISVQGLSLMASLDISGSMRSTDIYPNRLQFAKKKITGLLEQMPTDEVGMTAFAHSTFMLAPFTSDKSTLINIVEGVDESYISMASTDFSSLGELASKMLEKKKSKILVVVSDGGDAKALKGFGEILKDQKITLYAILVGTKRGAPVIDDKGRQMRLADGSMAITQMNEELGKIALESGGAYVVASNGNEDIEKLISSIRSKFHSQKQGDIKIKQQEEYFIYPLILATILLLIGLSSLPYRPGRGKKAQNRAFGVSNLMFFALFFALAGSPAARAGILDFEVLEEASTAYKLGDFNKSTKLYSSLDKQSAELNYDMANSYYKAGRYDKAIKYYKRAKGDGVDEHSRLHNLGNAYFRHKKLDNAITAYEKSLEYGEDEETSYNLELAKQKKKKKQKKQKKKKDQKKKDQKQKKKDNKEQKKNKENKEKKKQKEKKKNKQQKDKNKKKQKQNQKKNEEKKKKQSNKEKQSKQEKGKEKKGQSKQSKAEQKKAQKRKMTQKELRKLMKKMGNEKMPTLMYRAGNPKEKRRENVNPW